MNHEQSFAVSRFENRNGVTAWRVDGRLHGVRIRRNFKTQEEAAAEKAALEMKAMQSVTTFLAACGLRIWLPEHDLTFVDAAHLVPFSGTRNDHPTNGLALCKNHHWALDQRLIAPDLTRVWRVSRQVEPRRSRGEEELTRLAGQPLLAPVESAFAPDRLGLEWRFERLLS